MFFVSDQYHLLLMINWLLTHSTLCLAPWLNWLIIDFKVESFDFHTGSERLKSEISTFHTHTHKTQPNNQCFGTTTTVYQPQWSNAETIPNPIKGVHHCTSFCSEELPAASSLCNRNPSIWFLDSYVPPVQICQKKFMDCEFLKDERKWFCRPWKKNLMTVCKLWLTHASAL